MGTFYFDKLIDRKYGRMSFHFASRDYVYYHDHDFWEFSVCTMGSYEHKINGRQETLIKGDAILLKPGDFHSLKDSSPSASHLDIMIAVDLMKKACEQISPDLFEYLSKNTPISFPLSNVAIDKITNELRTIKTSEEQPRVETIKSFLIIEVLDNAYTAVSNKNSFSSKPNWLNKLLIQMDEPQNIDWTVNDVVKESGFSHAHLSRIFKKETGETLLDYVTDKKMSYARDLLIYSNLSASEIANNLGFSSFSYFNSLFKKHYNCSPGKYRQKYFNEDSKDESEAKEKIDHYLKNAWPDK